jgi:hypothetical protein
MAVIDIFNAVIAFDEATVKAKTQAELDGGTDIDSHPQRRADQRHGRGGRTL